MPEPGQVVLFELPTAEDGEALVAALCPAWQARLLENVSSTSSIVRVDVPASRLDAGAVIREASRHLGRGARLLGSMRIEGRIHRLVQPAV